MELSWTRVKPLSSKSVLPALEKELSVRFPASYIECATKYNGGHPSKEEIYSEELNELLALEMLLRIDEDPFNVYAVYTMLKNRIPPKIVPFFEDGFGNSYCFDFNVEGDPPVIFWSHEHEMEGGVIATVASSFDDFLSKLLDEEEADELERQLEADEDEDS